MNAKEKAQQLVNKFYNLKPKKMSDYSCILWPTAKECARIVVDEITKYGYEGIYWQEVKQEIDNL